MNNKIQSLNYSAHVIDQFMQDFSKSKFDDSASDNVLFNLRSANNAT